MVAPALEQADAKANKVASAPALELELGPIQKQHKALREEVTSITGIFDNMEITAKEQASSAHATLSTARGDAY